MPKVLFQIPIQDGFHGKSWLLETAYDLDFLPDEGDYFHPLKNDSESGMSMQVYRRWWAEDGSVQINTHKHILDPPDDFDMRNYVKIYRTWWTERDGNLVDLLLANGWWEYDPNKEDEPAKPTSELTDILQETFQAAVDVVVRRLLFGDVPVKKEEPDE